MSAEDSDVGDSEGDGTPIDDQMFKALVNDEEFRKSFKRSKRLENELIRLKQRKVAIETERIAAQIGHWNKRFFNKKGITTYLAGLSVIGAIASVLIGSVTFLVYLLDLRAKYNDAKLRSNAAIIFAAIRTGADENASRRAAANLLLLDRTGVLKLSDDLKIELEAQRHHEKASLPPTDEKDDFELKINLP